MLRDRAAQLLACVCGRFGEPYYALQVKASKQLLRTLLDASKPLPTHYGAVVGLAALGHATVRLLVLPQLEPYMAALHPLLGTSERYAAAAGSDAGPSTSASVTTALVAAAASPARQYEAWRVYGALQVRLSTTHAHTLAHTRARALIDVLTIQRSGLHTVCIRMTLTQCRPTAPFRTLYPAPCTTSCWPWLRTRCHTTSSLPCASAARHAVCRRGLSCHT